MDHLIDLLKDHSSLSDLVGAPKGYLAFAETKREGYFTLLFSHYMHSMIETGKTHLLYLETEEHLWRESLSKLKLLGIEGRALKVDAEGILTKESFLKQIASRRSSLFSFSWAHPLTGVIQPLDELISAAKQEMIAVHVDISATFGKLELMNCDAEKVSLELSLKETDSSHPFSSYTALFFQDRKEGAFLDFKSAIDKSKLTYFFAQAAEKTRYYLEEYAFEVSRWREVFERELISMGAHLFFQESATLPHLIIFAFEGIHAELLLSQLFAHPEMTFTASQELAHVLKICGVAPLQAYSALSCAFSKKTNRETVFALLENLKRALESLSKFNIGDMK